MYLYLLNSNRETFDVFVFFLNPVLILKLFKYNLLKEHCRKIRKFVRLGIQSNWLALILFLYIYLFAFFFLLLLSFFYGSVSAIILFHTLVYLSVFFFVLKKGAYLRCSSHYFTFLWKYIKSSDYHFYREHHIQPASLFLTLSFHLFLLFGLCGFYPVLMGCYSQTKLNNISVIVQCDRMRSHIGSSFCFAFSLFLFSFVY